MLHFEILNTNVPFFDKLLDMKRILLIDDDKMTHKLVKLAIQQEFDLVSVLDLKTADEILAKDISFDLFIIDRVLPDGDGLSLCQKIRQDERIQNIPIIFLSASTLETDKVAGLFAGADDYVSKPFGGLELRARIHARLKSVSTQFSVQDLLFEVQSSRVYLVAFDIKKELQLTRIEFKLLLMFAKSPDKIFSRSLILDQVWGNDMHVNDRVVDAHISHLRRKINESSLTIESLRGEGYRLIKTERLAQAA